MAEIAPATSATPAASTPVTPAAPPVVLGVPSFSHAAAAEKARAALKPATPASAAPPPAPATPPAPGIKTEGANLGDLTRLSSEKRALEQRVKELEPAAADAKLLGEVRELYKSGKKLDAIAKLAGADPTQEMESLLADYLKPDASPDAESKLVSKVNEVVSKLDAITAAQQAEKDAEKATAAKAVEADQAKAATGYVISQVKARTADLPHLSKAEENEVAGKVLSAVTKLRYDRGLDDPAAITAEQIQQLTSDALDEVEMEYEIRARRAAKRGAPPPAAVPGQSSANPTPTPAAAPTIEGLESPGVTVQSWGKTLTHAAAKEKLLANLRGGAA